MTLFDPRVLKSSTRRKFIFQLLLHLFFKMEAFFPTLSPTFSIVLVAAFLLLLWTPGKTKVFVNCQWPRRRKTNKQTNTLKQNQKLTNQKSRHLWSEPQAPTHVSYFTLSLSAAHIWESSSLSTPNYGHRSVWNTFFFFFCCIFVLKTFLIFFFFFKGL